MTDSMDYDGILSSQRGSLGRITATSGLNPSDFEWRESSNNFAGYGPVPAVVHKPTGFWFCIARNYRDVGYDSVAEEGRRVLFTPGAEVECESHRNLPWSDVEVLFRRWLDYTKREIEAPDFWDAVGAMRSADDALNEFAMPFTPHEQEGLAVRLASMEAHILNTVEGRAAEQLAFVSQEFSSLRTKLGELSRAGWLKTFFGTIANLAFTRLIPPEAARYAVEGVQSFFTSLRDHVLPPP